MRVFSMPLGELLYTFRRGSSSAAISSLSFSHDERFLVAAGSSPTIHVYKLSGAPGSGASPGKRRVAVGVEVCTTGKSSSRFVFWQATLHMSLKRQVLPAWFVVVALVCCLGGVCSPGRGDVADRRCADGRNVAGRCNGRGTGLC